MTAILVPVDFSAVSLPLIEVASGIAKAFHAHVTLLHVLPRNFEAEESGSPLDERALSNLYPKDWQTLEELANRVRSSGNNVTAKLAEGRTVPTVLDQAEELNVDMIVMGSHGHTSLYDLLVGSVSEGVLRRSRWPVLVVPSPGAKKHRHEVETGEVHKPVY